MLIKINVRNKIGNKITSTIMFQSTSPGMMNGGRGDKTSADWGYTDFSTFTANRRSSEYR